MSEIRLVNSKKMHSTSQSESWSDGDELRGRLALKCTRGDNRAPDQASRRSPSRRADALGFQTPFPSLDLPLDRVC